MNLQCWPLLSTIFFLTASTQEEMMVFVTFYCLAEKKSTSIFSKLLTAMLKNNRVGFKGV